MRTRGLFVALATGVSLAVAILWVLGAQGATTLAAPHARDTEGSNVAVAELHVCPAGPPSCDYASIQAAVDAAGHGDVIKVATGTYTDIHARNGFTQVVYIGLGVSHRLTIQGGYTTSDWNTPDPVANPTTVDARGQGRGLYIGSQERPTIEGLRITGGDAAAGGCAGPPYAPCLGGGVYGEGGYTVTNNVVFGNVADSGGGIRARDAVISGNTVTGNTASMGGGLTLGGTTSLSGNIVMSNTASSDAGGRGGGIMIEGADLALISNNVIANNRIDDGVEYGGSGVFIAGQSARMVHNSIMNNHGGDGIAVSVDEYFGGCGVASLALTNTLVSSQSVGIHIGCSVPDTVTVDGVLWHGTPVTLSKVSEAVVAVENQHTGDPAFAADGYHLTLRSAAIDRGLDTDVAVDIDGQSRPAGEGYDLGADELPVYGIYLPLVARNS